MKTKAFLRRLLQWLRQSDPWVLGGTALVGGILAALSVMRYAGYNAGMLDLGNMAQAIGSVARGHPLEFTYKLGNYSRLALHVELAYFLLAPLYALFPSPVTLLIFQALWFAAGAFPLFAWARRQLEHTPTARALVAIYLLYPVALTAILFDFHGDTLAMPALLFMLEALDRRAWRSYSVWLLLALSCKFYIAAPVAVMGGLLYLQGERRAGVWTTLTALTWGALAFLGVRPFFTPHEMSEVQATAGGYFTFYFGRIREVLLPQNITRRFLTGVIVFTPALWLGLRAALWLLPPLVIALPALISVGSVSAYDYRFHHYAVAVPFLLKAILEGATVLRRRQRASAPGQRAGRPWRHEVWFTLGITLLFTGLLVDVPLNPWFWASSPAWGWDDRAYGLTARDTFKSHWLREYIPAAAPVATSMYLAPHLVNRDTLYLFEYSDGLDLQPMAQRLTKVDYAIADALFDYTIPAPEVLGKQTGIPALTAIAGIGHQPSSVGGVLHDAAAIQYLLTSPDYALVAMQDGLLLFRRGVAPEEGLQQKVEWLEGEPPQSSLFDFDNGIELFAVRVELLGNRRYRLHFTWGAHGNLEAAPPQFAVSRLEGVPQARFVHLPTQVMQPPSTWPEGVLVEEWFDVTVPAATPAGTYPLWVGWYDSTHIAAAATDARSRLGSELQVTTLSVP